MSRIQIKGIYSVDAPEPCHIVELIIYDCTMACERLKGLSYPATVYGRHTEQAPFLIHYLSVDSGEIIGDFFYGWDNPEIWHQDVRVAFLMHFLEPGTKLTTPYGGVRIPDATVLPKRLSTIKYESPY